MTVRDTSPAPRRRRTQDERTAETRGALMNAAVSTIQRLGYGGATTALIAAEAGLSRGALTHQFESRADLMASVVQWVYDRELKAYADLMADKGRGDHLADWPQLLWAVLSEPGGIAVLEILQATRSDADLAERVRPVQMAIESASLKAIEVRFGGDERTRNALARLMVWAIRGLTIERLLISDPGAVDDSVQLLQLLIARSVPSGSIADLRSALDGIDDGRREQDIADVPS